MGSCPVEELSWWGVALKGTFLEGKCPAGESSGWECSSGVTGVVENPVLTYYLQASWQTQSLSISHGPPSPIIYSLVLSLYIQCSPCVNSLLPTQSPRHRIGWCHY